VSSEDTFGEMILHIYNMDTGFLQYGLMDSYVCLQRTLSEK
jgi:hypothetical protein